MAHIFDSNTRKYFKVEMKQLSVLLAVMVCIMSGCIVVPHHHGHGYYYGYPDGYYQYHHDWRGHRHYHRR